MTFQKTGMPQSSDFAYFRKNIHKTTRYKPKN